MLTGVHLGAYGQDFDPQLDLSDAIKALLPVPGLERIRISSVDPHEITPELWSLWLMNQRCVSSAYPAAERFRQRSAENAPPLHHF